MGGQGDQENIVVQGKNKAYPRVDRGSPGSVPLQCPGGNHGQNVGDSGNVVTQWISKASSPLLTLFPLF